MFTADVFFYKKKTPQNNSIRGSNFLIKRLKTDHKNFLSSKLKFTPTFAHWHFWHSADALIQSVSFSYSWAIEGQGPRSGAQQWQLHWDLNSRLSEQQSSVVTAELPLRWLTNQEKRVNMSRHCFLKSQAFERVPYRHHIHLWTIRKELNMTDVLCRDR